MVQAVVFDLDNTLLASDRARRRKLRSMLGPSVDLRAVRTATDEWYRRYSRGECSWEEQRIARWITVGVDPSRAVEVDEDYRSHYATIRLRLGARTMLTWLKLLELKLVLLSNSTPEYVAARLDSLRLRGFFDAIHDLVPPKSKPQPQVFVEAVERIGTRPEAAIMVGDDLDVDLVPALEAGYHHGIWFSRSTAACPERVTRVSGPLRATGAIEALIATRAADRGSRLSSARVVAAP